MVSHTLISLTWSIKQYSPYLGSAYCSLDLLSSFRRVHLAKASLSSVVRN
jgi:hypothetical protein